MLFNSFKSTFEVFKILFYILNISKQLPLIYSHEN